MAFRNSRTPWVFLFNWIKGLCFVSIAFTCQSVYVVFRDSNPFCKLTLGYLLFVDNLIQPVCRRQCFASTSAACTDLICLCTSSNSLREDTPNFP